MANPERAPDQRFNEPLNPLPPLGVDPLIAPDTRLNPANSQDPKFADNRVVVEQRRSGSGVLIAAVVLVLAVVAYFVFAPGTSNSPATPPAATDTTAPAAPAATAPAAPAAEAPAAMAPAAPADANPPAAATPPAAAEPATPPTNEAAPAPAAPAPAAPAPAN